LSRGRGRGGTTAPTVKPMNASMMNALRQGAAQLASATTSDEALQGELAGALFADAMTNFSGNASESLSSAFNRINEQTETVGSGWFDGERERDVTTYTIDPVAPDVSSGIGQPDNEIVVLNQAREALSNGKDRAAVIQMLTQMGIDPSKL